MSLFQKSVLKKYLKKINEQKLEKAWKRFSKHFHNTSIQNNIRKAKEEQYQGEFLIDLFVKILGYTKNPLPNFNLTTELRNVKGQKKADGGILKKEKAIAVIELKGVDTINLSKVELQAFGYKNNQPDASYVITSNFEKLRFYIDNATAYEEFNLFELTKEEFKILWLCLAKENLFKDLPKKIKEESLIHETLITNKLYKDYTAFRIELFENIVRLNPKHDKLIIFKKTQKLLDRFLFLRFAEDRGLLSPNSTRQIIKDWENRINSLSGYIPLYDNFKRFFIYLNKGYKSEQYDIFAYNGGLFEADNILDNIKISDATLYRHTLLLSGYDFDSEVSVNILGYIFEHSLNEIEAITADLAGEKLQKQKTKRKKEGIFYTPNYITKYIVEHTIGSLCEKKKNEIGILETAYEQKHHLNEPEKVSELQKRLKKYQNWLLQLTICDPACGSGAFLNQALEFLITEHDYVDELHKKLVGKKTNLPNRNNIILENNIYGVDINEDAVHIAKLSLWLRTAKEGQKLTFLNNNIQAGNSLIDDKKLAGTQAFNWQKAFPKVFEKGGFDVIIGLSLIHI